MSTSRRRLLSAAAFCLLSAAAAIPALSQNAALGNISGIVRDASGAVVPNAAVVVTNTGTGAARTLTTDSEGHYIAGFLQPGQYEVVLGGGAFGKIDQKNISVTVGGNNTVDATLPAASVTTDVVVTTDEALIDTDRVAQSQTVSEQLVSNLPVNGRRWDNFVLLTPQRRPRRQHRPDLLPRHLGHLQHQPRRRRQQSAGLLLRSARTFDRRPLRLPARLHQGV